MTPHQFLTEKTPTPTACEGTEGIYRDVDFVESYSIVRPLLSVSRFEIGNFCSFWQLPVYPDISNQKVKFSRNRIRRQLLPVVKLFFNPKIENTLLQFAEITEAENRCIEQVTQKVSFTCSPLLLPSSSLPYHVPKGVFDWGNVDVLRSDMLKCVLVLAKVGVVTRGIRRTCEAALPSECAASQVLRMPKDKPTNTALNSLFFFPRYSVPIGISFWLWNKRVCTTKPLKMVSKTGVECMLLNTSIVSCTELQYVPKFYSSIFKTTKIQLCCLLCNTKGLVCLPSSRSEETFSFEAREATKIVMSSKKKKLLAQRKVASPKGNFGLLSSYSHAALRRYSWVTTQRAKKTCFQPNTLKLNKNISQQKKVENFFIRNFFVYFDTLKREKRDLYWPLVISFLPPAFQRRIIKVFLLNQNWKNLQYSQVEDFLTKRTKLQKNF